MKWKRTLTAEEMALIVLGLDNFKSINEVSMSDFTLPNDLDRYIIVEEARAICAALLEEIILVDPFTNYVDERVIENTHLIVAARASFGDEGYMNPELTTVTRESAAQWFLSVGDIEKAKRLMPSIETGSISLTSQNSLKDSSQNMPRTPEPSLINSLGMMAIMLAKKQANLSRNNKPNASQIVIAIEQTAAEHGFSLEQISNLQKDISMAVKKVLGETG
jgi:hypothetical protein